jgi:RimJ/RimL family protein N-acetyltransferase
MPEMNDHEQRVGDLVPGWSPRPRPERVPLTGPYVALEPLSTAHAPALHAALCGPGDEALWTYRPTSAPTLAAFTATVLGLASSPENVTWALVPTGGSPSGMVTFTRIDTDHGQVEVASVIFAQTLQRSTAATEAIHLLMGHAFDDLGYRRFEWKCDALNEPSRRAAVRLGLTYEGRFRNHMVVRGRNRDTDWFSVTDAEWPGVRAAHRTWLDPANFDDSGQQRSSLSDLTSLRSTAVGAKVVP